MKANVSRERVKRARGADVAPNTIARRIRAALFKNRPFSIPANELAVAAYGVDEPTLTQKSATRRVIAAMMATGEVVKFGDGNLARYADQETSRFAEAFGISLRDMIKGNSNG